MGENKAQEEEKKDVYDLKAKFLKRKVPFELKKGLSHFEPNYLLAMKGQKIGLVSIGRTNLLHFGGFDNIIKIKSIFAVY